MIIDTIGQASTLGRNLVAGGENPFMLLLFDVFLLAVDETIEHRPFLGNTEIVLNISDCYVIAFGRDAKENAR